MKLIVVGLGAMGSSIAMRAALRGANVLGIDQYERGHALGASSGRSRIVRQAYFEDEAYVPLLLRAYELWRDVERRTGTKLLHLTGLLLVGCDGSEILSGTLEASQTHSLRVEQLDRRDVLARYPSLRLDEGERGVFEPLGGFVVPETAVASFQAIAEDAGAQLRFDVAMESWCATQRGVEVRLLGGDRIEGDALVLALGPWCSNELTGVGVPLNVQRNVQCWFAPETDAYDARRFPAFLVDRPSLPAPLYGFPDCGDGVKAALHGYGESVTPETLVRTIDAVKDVAPVARALDDFMPGAAGSTLEARACMYALTPDGNFVIDRHPAHENVVLCCGFSGHGFKFASVVGEIVAELVLDGRTRHDIAFLRARRFHAEENRGSDR